MTVDYNIYYLSIMGGENMKKKINIEGMSCKHCVMHVHGALEDIGAKDIDVNLDKKVAVADVGNLSDDKIKAAIEDAGYNVTSIENA